MAETLLNASIPSIAELCCVVAKIDESEIRDSSAKSHFHWKTMKCRFIIHMMQDTVIASPVYETIASIHVITSVEFFNGETFRNNLKDMNMTWSAPRPVTPDVYAKCLRYSIQFAIAPRWNRVGQYFINDQYFLTFPGTFAMRFNLTVRTGNDKKVQSTMKLQPLKIQMYELKLEDLKIPREIIAHFMADPRGIIDVASIGTFRVTVLPSLKRGRLMTILKYIPATSPFKSYGELRRHWKNMYGYRLPKIDNDMIYYDIQFPVPTADRFLYPNICVRSQISERPYLGNAEIPVREFLQDISETMPLVCGQTFKITGNNRQCENFNSIPSLENDETRLFHDLPKTPENATILREKFHHTTRLSFSRAREQFCREPSTLMSPTSSLRGYSHRGSMKNSHIRNIPSSLLLSRSNDYPSETQNCCPNAGESVNDDYQEKNLEDAGKMRFEDSDDEGKMSQMKTKISESRIFVTRPSTADSMNDVETKSFVKTSKETSTFGSIDETVKLNKPIIIKDEILSRYFVTAGEEKKGTNEKITSPNARTITLSQKLERNLNSVRETANDNSMEIVTSDSQITPYRPDHVPRSHNSIYDSRPPGSGNYRSPKNSET